MFQTKAVGKNKAHFAFNNSPPPTPPKSCQLWDNAEKYGTERQATDDNLKRCMRFECWLTKATDTRSEYEIFIAFPRQIWSRESACLEECVCSNHVNRRAKKKWHRHEIQDDSQSSVDN